MLGKTVIIFKSDAQALFTMLYVGARLVAGNITKSTLYSMAVHGACESVPMVLFDSALKPYTFKELAKHGEDAVKGAFNSVMKSDDVGFYREMSSFKISCSAKNEEIYEPLALKVLKKHLMPANLRDTDIENIVKVILISEDDLRADEASVDEESGEGLTYNERPKKSYSFLNHDKPYACYGELNKIINRYNNLCAKEEVYKKLFRLFFSILDFVAEKHGYSRSSQSGECHEVLDSTLDFYKIFSEELKSLNLENFMHAGEFAEFRKEYLRMLIAAGEMEKKRNCSGECEVCVYSTGKCVPVWLKRDMAELLKKMCFLDIFESSKLKSFEKYCMENFLGEKRADFLSFTLNAPSNE